MKKLIVTIEVYDELSEVSKTKSVKEQLMEDAVKRASIIEKSEYNKSELRKVLAPIFFSKLRDLASKIDEDYWRSKINIRFTEHGDNRTCFAEVSLPEIPNLDYSRNSEYKMWLKVNMEVVHLPLGGGVDFLSAPEGLSVEKIIFKREHGLQSSCEISEDKLIEDYTKGYCSYAKRGIEKQFKLKQP